MYEKEFKDLFSADEQAELAAAASDVEAAADAAAKAKPKKDGVWYDHNEENSQGHSISVYAINLGGKTVAWAIVNNDITETSDLATQLAAATGGAATVHAIFIHNAHRTDGWMSHGLALSYEHNDGTGIHIDGQTIRSFVMPRLSKIVGRLYGI